MKNLSLIYYYISLFLSIIFNYLKNNRIKEYSFIIYILILVFIILYLYFFKLLPYFIYDNTNTFINTNYDNTSIVEAKNNIIDEKDVNNLTVNSTNYINNFYYLIKNEVINMKNNFSELFKLNDSKYAYHPSCFVKDNSLTE